MERTTKEMKTLSKYIVAFFFGVLLAACVILFALIFNKNYEITSRVESIELLTRLYGENATKNSDGIVSIQDVIKAQSERLDQLQADIDYLKSHPPKDGGNGRNGRDGEDGKDGADGKTPVKGIDYFDGKDGEKGDKGDKGDTPFVEFRCDAESTYWQVRYSPDANWEYLNGERVKCTRKNWFGL